MHFVVTLFYVLPLLLHPRLSHRTPPPSSPLAAPPLRHSPPVCLFLSPFLALFVVSRPFSSSICASSYSRRYPLVQARRTYSRVFASISPYLGFSVRLFGHCIRERPLTYVTRTILPRWSFKANQIFARPTFPLASISGFPDLHIFHVTKSTSTFLSFCPTDITTPRAFSPSLPPPLSIPRRRPRNPSRVFVARDTRCDESSRGRKDYGYQAECRTRG